MYISIMKKIFRKNNYWNYLKILNPVGQLKEKNSLLEAKNHFKEMKDNDVIKKDSHTASKYRHLCLQQEISTFKLYSYFLLYSLVTNA